MKAAKVDLTVAAIPVFVTAMAAEYWWQRRHPVEPGTRAGDYQLADTMASLSMGVGSLIAPYVAKRLLDPLTPGVGRFGKALLGISATAAALTGKSLDVVAPARNSERSPPASSAQAQSSPLPPR